MNNAATPTDVKRTPHTWRHFLILLAFVLSASSAQPQSQRVWGYVAWWMKDEWNSLSLASFERLVFVQIKVGADGLLVDRHGWPDQWADLRQAARKSQVPIDIALTVFEAAVFNELFLSVAAKQRLLDELLALAESADVSGLHLDFEVNEGVNIEAISGFRSFVSQLSERMRRQHPTKQLSAFLPFGEYLRIFDAATVKHLDRFVLQGYDAHYLDSPVAGPVSPLEGMDVVNWAKMLAAADGLKIARDKMLMGFPLYGYEWTVPSCTPRGAHQGKGAVTTLLPVNTAVGLNVQNNAQDRVAKYGARVEPVSNSLFYMFVGDSGVCTVGWFEDSWSLQVKAEWVVRHQLGGIAFFPLGYDQGVLVNTLLARWGSRPRSTIKP